MKLLLDTHVLLWWLGNNRRLTAKARRTIADPGAMIHVSAVSLWEAAIKRALGRLRFESAELLDAISTGGFQALPITARHALAAGDLPRHHEDPFDRMLVAQAQAEGLTLVTHDSALEAYSVPMLTV